jgi:AraC-like DNA-binding protein
VKWQMAAAAGVSLWSLQKAFERAHRTTPVAHVRHVCLQAARRVFSARRTLQQILDVIVRTVRSGLCRSPAQPRPRRFALCLHMSGAVPLMPIISIYLVIR